MTSLLSDRARDLTVESTDRATTVLLVDDHALVRTALKMLLEVRLSYGVVEAGSGQDAVEALKRSSFDVMICDVHMPERDGLWTLSAVREIYPDLPVVMLSHSIEEDVVVRALADGASGFLIKDASVAQVEESIRTAIAKRGVYLHPLVAAGIVHAQRSSAEQLTAREVDVLRHVVSGETNDEIAAALYITEKTVKTHMSGIFRKLGVTNRTQAATKAVADGLVSD